MADSITQIEVEAPIDTIWRFIESMDNWAPLVPGYIAHEVVSEKESRWLFTGEFGLIRKKIDLNVFITSLSAPNTVRFSLKDKSEKLMGTGFFEAYDAEPNKTIMTGCLEMNAKGAKGPMINAFLHSRLPIISKEFTEAVANKILELTRT
ncbi:CoxG family protein [Heyndrickxia acidicola]|uniref:SRPBCC family protein n=1 Tax=Heyndrickxia acidicola TaxID=209389 RepID=A0ABU6MBH2_9BACI|nr:SRPBCC family protein [Heyndrickxia acidicola]MED1201614.1 SRPBCC family protein [Heyndrickxia acidicola]